MSQQLLVMASELGSALVFARVNCDEQPQITSQFGVSSVPTLILLRAGQPIDGLTGVTPIVQVQDMLAKYLPKKEDELLLKASAMLLDDDADINTIYTIIKEAITLDAQRLDIKTCYIEVLIKIGQLDGAQQLLDVYLLEDKNANYQRLVSLLELAQQAGQSPEITALEQQHESEPNNKEVSLQLAICYSQVNKTPQALDILFGVLQSELDFSDAKKRYLDIIAALPSGDPLASSSRRKLFSLLH